MTIAGNLNNIALGLQGMSRPKAIMTWQEISASRNITREIGQAVAALNDEVKDIQKGDIKRFDSAMDRFEKNTEDALKNFSSLFTNVFIELFNLRNGIIKQKQTFDKVKASLPADRRNLMEARIAQNRQKFLQVLTNVSNISTTALQKGL